MISRVLVLVLAVGLAAAAGSAQAPQGGQSDGALRPRPGANRQPEFPPPSIIDYKPRTTLVVPEHPVPRAKFPVIDVHSHQPAPISAEQLASVVSSMDPLNLQLLVNASGQSGNALVRSIEAIRSSPHRNRMAMFTNISFRNVGPGFGQKAAQQLEADVKAGAVGLGEISKDFGLGARKADGARLTLDDPELDPIWETAARLRIPVLIHTADPQEFFQPLDFQNERWLELALFSNRRFPPERYPTFEQLMSERDRLFKKHPKTTFIAAFKTNDDTPRASKEELFGLSDHLERALEQAEYFRAEHMRRAQVQSLRSILHKGAFTQQDVRTLRGVVAHLEGRRFRNRRDGE
jgi:hypothetical protein